MTQNELINLFRMIDIDYPNNQIAKAEADRKLFAARWMQKLERYDAKSVYSAYEVHVTRSPAFAPNWQHLDQILAEYQNHQIQPEEAWGKIQEATLRYGHTQPKEAEEFLGKDIWTIVNRFGWQYFCMMPIEEESTHFAQFRNAYSAEIGKSREQARLSPSVAAILTGNIVKQMGSGQDG